MPFDASAKDSATAILSYPFIGGIMGALISRRFSPPTVKVWEAATSVLSGGIMALYLTPLITHYLDIDGLSGGVGFAVGLFGLSLTAALYYTIKTAHIWDLVMARYGSQPNTPADPEDSTVDNGGH